MKGRYLCAAPSPVWAVSVWRRRTVGSRCPRCRGCCARRGGRTSSGVGCRATGSVERAHVAGAWGDPRGRKRVPLAFPFWREVEPSPNGHKALTVINWTPLCSGKRPKPAATPCCRCDRGPSSPSVERESPFRAAMRRSVAEEHWTRADTCLSGASGTQAADGPQHHASATIPRCRSRLDPALADGHEQPRIPTTGTGPPRTETTRSPRAPTWTRPAPRRPGAAIASGIRMNRSERFQRVAASDAGVTSETT